MDCRQTTHRALIGRLALGWAFAALVICSASVCAQTPQQAAPPPPSASQQAATRPRTPAQEEMREFRLRIRDYAKFVAQHPRIKNLSEEQREKLIQFVAGNMLFVLLHVTRAATPLLATTPTSPSGSACAPLRRQCWLKGTKTRGWPSCVRSRASSSAMRSASLLDACSTFWEYRRASGRSSHCGCRSSWSNSAGETFARTG
jgi:hypothetical protein